MPAANSGKLMKHGLTRENRSDPHIGEWPTYIDPVWHVICPVVLTIATWEGADWALTGAEGGPLVLRTATDVLRAHGPGENRGSHWGEEDTFVDISIKPSEVKSKRRCGASSYFKQLYDVKYRNLPSLYLSYTISGNSAERKYFPLWLHKTAENVSAR